MQERLLPFLRPMSAVVAASVPVDRTTVQTWQAPPVQGVELWAHPHQNQSP